jgi:predicted transcriptional regulator
MAGMEVHFNPDLEAKLAREAAAQGRTTETLLQEAVERSLDCDEWFLREVEKGGWPPRIGANLLSMATFAK